MIKSKSRSHSVRYGLLLLLVVIIGGVAAYVIHLDNSSPQAGTRQKTPTATITKLPESPAAAKNPDTTTDNYNQGTDKNTPSSTDTPASEWTESQSGVIVVHQPTANQTIQNGAILSGTASTSPLQYTLIDNEVGVISQGMINVSNGKFSVSMSFQPQASSGRLDVFSTDSNGKEINEVQIPVNF